MEIAIYTLDISNIMAEAVRRRKKKKKEEPKKQGFFSKLKDAAEDKEEQMMILSTFVRLGILVWSGAILTLAYVELPSALKMPKQDLDPTFIASVFTGVLATFGVQTSKKGAQGGGRIQWWSIKSRYGEVDCSSITNCTSTNYSY